MEEKLCPACETVKPLSAFNKDKQNKSGVSCYCRECRKAKNSQWAQKQKPLKKAYNKAYREKNRVKVLAHQAVTKAIRHGLMAPAEACECNDCRAPATELHHHSYDEDHWLDVVPLCRSCHTQRHQLLKQ